MPDFLSDDEFFGTVSTPTLLSYGEFFGGGRQISPNQALPPPPGLTPPPPPSNGPQTTQPSGYEEPIFSGLIPRPTAQDVGATLGTIGALFPHPGDTRSFTERMQQDPIQQGGAEKALAGAAEGGADLVEGIANYYTSPEGVAMLGLSITPLAPAVALKWSYDMIHGGVLNTEDALDAYKKGDTQRLVKNIVSAAALMYGGAKSGIHGVRGVAEPFIQEPQKYTVEDNRPQETVVKPETSSEQTALNSAIETFNKDRAAEASQAEVNNSEIEADIARAEEIKAKIRTAPLQERFQMSAELEKIKNKYGGTLPTPGETAQFRAERTAETTGNEIGFTLDKTTPQIGSVSLEGLTPEQRAALEAVQPRQWAFTDKRPNSPTLGRTFYVKEGASRAEILKRHQEKMDEESAQNAPKTSSVQPTAAEPVAAGSDRVTPGASTGVDIAQGTGLANAIGEVERVSHGLPEATPTQKRAMGTAWEKSGQTILSDSSAGVRLADELKNDPERGMTDDESALILRHKVSLENAKNDAAERTTTAKTPEDKAKAQLDFSNASNQLLELLDAIKHRGSEWGREGRWRQALAFEDFSLETMRRNSRTAKGKDLTPAQESELKSLHDKIAELQARVDAADKNASVKSSGQAVDEHVVETKKKVSAEDAADKTEGVVRDVEGERASIIEGIKAQVESDHYNLPTLSNYIRKLSENFVRSGITERDALIDAVHGELQKIIPELNRTETMDAMSGFGKFRPLTTDAVKLQVKDINSQIQSVRKLEKILAQEPIPQTGFGRIKQSLEKRKLEKLVNEYKKRFGVVVTDPAKQLKSSLDAIKTRLRHDIEDLNYQLATGKKIIKGKSGVPYDAEANALKARRDALKAQYDEIFPKAEMSDEQRVKIAMNAVERSIADLTERIKNKDLGPRTRESKTPVTEELEAARARRDALGEELQSLRDAADPKKSPEEKALAALKGRMSSRMSELTTKLYNGDFSKPPKKAPLVLDHAAETMKADLERFKNQHRLGILKEQRANRPTWIKGMDLFAKWFRGAALSSPVTFAKLAAATAEQVAFHPLDEMAGSIYKKVFPKAFGKAPIEGGGLNVKAEVASVVDGLTRGFKDAYDSLRKSSGNRSEIDALYAKTGLPQEAIEFFGLLHGAEKAPLKRYMFRYAMEQQAAWALKNGVDFTDPMVQSRMGLEAYKYANRGIFQENNAVSDMYSRALTRLREKSKITGRESVAGRIAESGLRSTLPVTKVGTNLVGQAFERAFGSIRGGVELAAAYARGIDTLSPAEADMIARHLKKGSVGGAVMLASFFLPSVLGGFYQRGEKRKKSDVGTGEIKSPVHLPSFVSQSGDIPAYLLHNPLIEATQLGATARRVAESKFNKHDREKQGVGAGALAATLGLTVETPFIREMVDTGKLFDPREQSTWAGGYAQAAIPQAIQWTARQMDKNSKGEVIQRKPKTFKQHLEMGIPGMRKYVPVKASSGAVVIK